MKGIVVALLAGTLIGSVLTGLTYLSSADASGASQGSLTVAAATPAAVPVVAPAPVPFIGELTEDAVPIRENVDPVLGTGDWGIRSRKVKNALGHGVTANNHQDVENYENALLTDQQSEALLKIFRNAHGVHRIIERYDGDPDTDVTHYYVLSIHADEDNPAPGNPWVTATLRADFPSPEGMRGIQMDVYRRKTDKGELDNTPYVALTQISYLDQVAELTTRPGYSHSDGDDWAVVNDNLETIYFEN